MRIRCVAINGKANDRDWELSSAFTRCWDRCGVGGGETGRSNRPVQYLRDIQKPVQKQEVSDERSEQDHRRQTYIAKSGIHLNAIVNRIFDKIENEKGSTYAGGSFGGRSKRSVSLPLVPINLQRFAQALRGQWLGEVPIRTERMRALYVVGI